MKFYKNSNGGYILGDYLLSPSTPKYLHYYGNSVEVIYNEKTLYKGLVTKLEKEDGSTYSDKDDLESGVGDFFVDASFSSKFVFTTLLADNWGNSDTVELFGGNVNIPPQQSRLLLTGDYSDYTTFTADQFQIKINSIDYLGESTEINGTDFVIYFNNLKYKLILNSLGLYLENTTLSAIVITNVLELNSGLREYIIEDGSITENTWITFIVRSSGVQYARAAKVQRNGTFEQGKMKVYSFFVPSGDIEVFYHIQDSVNVNTITDFYVQNMDYSYIEIDNLLNS